MDFRVELDSFRGPLDLLLFLVRRHEIKIGQIPLATVVEQFHSKLDNEKAHDADDVGDFLETASLLAEIKSRLALPQEIDPELQKEDEPDQLVKRLLEYKKFKDASIMLEERGAQWRQRYCRIASDLPPRQRDLSDQPIHEVEVWDLVGAFARVFRDSEPRQGQSIVYDDTPIHVYMHRMHKLLEEHGKAPLSDMFQTGLHKSALIGMFLAILELVRRHHVHAQQNQLHGEIWIMPGEQFAAELDLSDVDNYDGAAPEAAPDEPTHNEPANGEPNDITT